MRVQNAVAFLAAEIDRRVEDPPGQTGTPALMADRQSFKLGELGEIPNPDASDRLAVLVADQVRGGKIVAVEFLFEWASLLAHVDRAADGDDARHFVHRPNDSTVTGSRGAALTAATSFERSNICRLG